VLQVPRCDHQGLVRRVVVTKAVVCKRLGRGRPRIVVRKNGCLAALRRTVTLGDREITRIGLGTNRLTNTPENREFLKSAAATELNLIDTAHVYTSGDSEEAIGEALAPFGDDLVVATKGGYHAGGGAEELHAQLEQSFERLGVDTITLYYLHRVHDDLPIADAMAIFKRYRDAGRIGHVGLSEVSVEQIEQAREMVAVAAVQNQYNLAERKWDEVVDYCAAEGIVFVPFYPLRPEGPPALDEIAEAHGATPNQVKLAWLLRRARVVAPIPGTLSLDHLKENFAALDLELSDEEFERLS
jgi:pyridoxine 4-dehydrogenase